MGCSVCSNMCSWGCSNFQQAHNYQIILGKIYNLERQVRTLCEMKGLKVTDSITASFLIYTLLIVNHSVSTENV